MISTDFTKLSVQEIKSLIQKETEKGVDNLDTNYIDLCFKLLEIKNNKLEIKQPKFTKSTKIVLVAAAVMVVFLSVFTVSAQLNFDIPEKIAQLIGDNAEIDPNYHFANTTADGYSLSDKELVKEISNYGIFPVTIPEEMTKEDCKIKKINDLTTDSTISKDLEIEFEYLGNQGNITIQQFEKNYELIGNDTARDVISGQMISANGMDILVFEREDNCTIRYKDNCTEYNIYLECDLKTSINFAKSIK